VAVVSPSIVHKNFNWRLSMSSVDENAEGIALGVLENPPLESASSPRSLDVTTAVFSHHQFHIVEVIHRNIDVDLLGLG